MSAPVVTAIGRKTARQGGRPGGRQAVDDRGTGPKYQGQPVEKSRDSGLLCGAESAEKQEEASYCRVFWPFA